MEILIYKTYNYVKKGFDICFTMHFPPDFSIVCIHHDFNAVLFKPQVIWNIKQYSKRSASNYLCKISDWFYQIVKLQLIYNQFSLSLRVYNTFKMQLCTGSVVILSVNTVSCFSLVRSDLTTLVLFKFHPIPNI